MMRRAGDNAAVGVGVEDLMRIALAETGGTYPHPNPRVGAVLASAEGTVISVAAHQRPGEAHAEIRALDGVADASGSMLIVTLEPCNHHGRTPPCTEAIIEAGVSSVVIGVADPDERVSGQGIERLRAAGIDVTVGVLPESVVRNDPGYFHHRTSGLPHVTLKLATTIDGQAGAADGTSQWITSPEAREDAHRLRAESDVVIVGSGTIAADDPRLDVRLEGYEGRQPRPVIIAGQRDIPRDRSVLARDPIIYRPDGGRTVDPVTVVRDLGANGIVSAMVEGGPAIASSFLRADVVDEIVWYTAAKLAGGKGLPAIAGVFETMADMIDIEITAVDRIGPDIKITARRMTHDA